MTVTASDTAPARIEPRWGAPEVFGAFALGILASFVGSAVLAAIKGVPADEMTVANADLAEIAVLQGCLYIGYLGVPLLLTRLRGNGPVFDLGWWMKWRDAPIGLAIGVACQFVLVPLVTLPVLWLSDTDQADLEAPARELTDKANGGGWVLLFLVIAVVAPIAEEVLFRGMLQRTLARVLPVWPTIVVTAAIFGVSHFQLLQFPALMAFGLVLSVLAHRSGRLGINTWAHVGFNATTIVLLYSQR